MTAENFIKAIVARKEERPKGNVIKFFTVVDGETVALGLKFGTVFEIAKAYTNMSITEVNKLLDSKFYEVRMGAVSIMDFKARNKKTSESEHKELFDLYLKRHDRLNNWGFVDRGAYNIIGEYLIDKSKDILFKLAKSKYSWERRTAIVATYAFIKKGQTKYTFDIAEILVNDKEESINKAIGSWIREAGKKDNTRLLAFLDKHAKTMPRVTLRYAIEKLDKRTKEYYMNMK